ncbi:MAG: glycosyltransferase [Eubacteriales bacterium]|nr:glycosyltransferase [Eubacteriales bacterium]
MKISIIIPVYQVEKYIGACLDSVLAQTFNDLEIICIHDAGGDASPEIVKAYAEKDARIRFYENEQNMGLASVRNRGMDLARGKYLYFLDSDDMIRPDALEELYRRAEAEQLDVQIFGAEFIYETRALEEKFHTNHAQFKQEYPKVTDGRSLYVKWMDIWDWMPSQPRFFYRRDFLQKNTIRFVDGMLHEDETFAFDVLMHADRIRVTNDEFFIRRFREDSIMSSIPRMKNVEGCIEILKHVSEYPVKDEALLRSIRFYMSKIFRDAARKYRLVMTEAAEEQRNLSEETIVDPVRMAIYHLIEMNAMWGE